MPPLNWKRIMRVNLDSLEQNEEEFEIIYNILTEGNFDPDAAQDVRKMEKLFDLSKMIMRVKATEAEVAGEEIESLKKRFQGRVDRLESEIHHLHKHAGGGEQSFIREIQLLEDRNNDLEKAVVNNERELEEERKSNKQMSIKIKELEKLNKDYKQEVESCKTSIYDYQRQIEQQRQNVVTQHGGDAALQSKLAEKNRDLNKYLDEIRSLSEANAELEEKLEDVGTDLKESAIEMDKMTEEYTKLKTVLQQTDQILEEMRKERDVSRAQVQDLRDQVASKTDNDEAILFAVNSKVEEWKMVIASKDEEIANCRRTIEDLRRQASISQIDTDKQTIAALRRELAEKNEHVDSLEQKLQDVSSEMKEITDQIENIKQQADKGLPSAYQQKQINELHSTLDREKMAATLERNRIKLTEKAVAEKDKELNELVTRLMRYERGEYGLSQAVQEIKDLKANLRIRDEKIIDLTSQINKVGIAVNDVEAENEELRDRLGMDPREPLDIEAVKEKKLIKTEQQAALNRVLSKEIERLEEERLELKRKLRKQALHRGQRAVELGLTAEDLALAELSDDGGEERRVAKTKSEPALSPLKVDNDQLSANNKRLKNEAEKQEVEVNSIKMRLKALKTENKELKDENHQLEVGLRELLGQLRESPVFQSDGGQVLLRVPALEKLIAMFECRSATGQYDVHVELRANLGHMAGRNEEIRQELQKARDENTSLAVVLDKKDTRITKLEKEISDLRHAGDGFMKIQPLVLPKGMTPSSTEVIGCLNEYLTQSIHECSLKETMLQKLEDELENFKRKFAVIIHQKGLLYEEYLKEKTRWEVDLKKREDETSELKQQREHDGVRLLEYDRLLENLSTDSDTLKKRLGEQTRKITVLRVNEKSLARRYTAMQEVESSLRRENEKLKKDIVDMEGSVMTRLGYLERFRETAGYKMAVLQRSLDESCPTRELETVNRDYNELTAKYRDLLQRENLLVERSTKLESLQSDVSHLQMEREKLMKELETEKQKSHTLEQTLVDLLGKGGKIGTSDVRAEEINSISRKIATLEIKELNERQRASHATKRYEQVLGMLQNIEERNGELENKVEELTKLNMEGQRIERELRSELEGVVTKDLHDAMVNRLHNLEESESKLKVEVMRLKEISEVASHQAEAVQSQQESRDKELLSLRKQLYDIQMENDDKTVIGKLHHHIVALQVSEGMAIKKLETAQSKVSKLDAHILRLEQKLDEKDQDFYHAKLETRNKARYLKQTIQDLRRQFSGCLPLLKQERFADAMRNLQESKMALQQDLDKAHDEREKASLKLAELQMKHKNLEELLATLRDGKGAAKVMEWQKRIEDIRLENLKLNRNTGKQNEQIKFLENLNRTQEHSIVRLEEENAKITKQHEERTLMWDQREVELERTISRLEHQQAEMAQAAFRFEEATGSVPDPNLPIANQLEEATRRIKDHVKIIVGCRHENRTLKTQVGELKRALDEHETKNTQNAKIINELRLRLPVTERQLVAQQVESMLTKSPDYEAKKAFQVAQSTIASLQKMISKKEESILKYQELLKESRDEMQAQAQQHKAEVKLLQDRLQLEADEALRKFKAQQNDVINSHVRSRPDNKELRRLSELEELTLEQENALASAAERYQRSRNEIGKLKVQYEDKIQDITNKAEVTKEKFTTKITELENELSLREQHLRDRTKENEALTEELEAAREANDRAPTRAMKSLLERLRNQLLIKDKEQKTLSKALRQLRADMVNAAEENLRANTQLAGEEVNVQLIVARETSELRESVKGLESKHEKMKTELKKYKEKEEKLTEENNKLKKDIEKKNSSLSQMNEEKDHNLDKCEQSLRNEKRKRQEYEQRMIEMETKLKILNDKNDEKEREETDDSKTEEKQKMQKVSEEVLRWEEGKKWQHKVENLKMKLAEKTKELEKAEKSLRLCRDALNRGDRTKASSQNKLKSAYSRSSVDASLVQRDDVIHELKQKVFEVESENEELQRRLRLEKDVRLQELELQNKDLKERLSLLELQLRHTPPEKEDNDAVDALLYEDLVKRNRSLQNQLLEIRKENMEMQFSLEEAKKENPRLKARVADLQEYTEILKSEVEASKKREKSRKKALGTGIAGQSVEDMERVIAAMRRVVERLQTENDNLKKHPVDGNSQHNDLTKENKKLKQELHKLKQSHDAPPQRKGIEKISSKLVGEHEKLRKDYGKEIETSNMMKVKIAALENDLKDKNDEIRRLEGGLREAESRVPNLEGLDSKQWKSAVATRMFEQKVKSLEGELEKKTNMLNDIKKHLRGSVDKEEVFLKKQSELEEKIAILERFPTDIQLDSNLVKEMQNMRLRLASVEAEKNELHSLLKRMKELSEAGQLPSDMDQEDVLRRLVDYDRILKMNTELEINLKTVELERDRLRSETIKLRKELEAFDPAFFEEIEDLKYNFQKSIERNVLYERQLRELSRRFEVQVNIPREDDY